MRQLQPVIWSKGTFLSAQHLQVQDRFIEDALRFRLQALSYRPYGFVELVLDRGGLLEGQLVCSRASGILPDGMPFSIPDSDPAPRSKGIADSFEPGTKSIDVFLAVPEFRYRGLNVSITEANAGTRFRASIEMYRDEVGGVAEKPIQIARKNFRLLTSAENLEGSTVMPVARVVRDENGTFALDANFVPPLLFYSANDRLESILRGLLEIMSAKSGLLSGMRRQKNQSLADFTASDIANFWLLYTVNSYFPLLNHFYQTKQVHPEELYSSMLSLAGSLTAFSNQIQPQNFPDYDHDKLGECYGQIDAILRTLLESVVPSNFVALSLKPLRNSIYGTPMADDKYFDNTRMYLAFQSEAKPADIVNGVPRLVKLGSTNQIETLVSQALPGVPLVHVPVPPSALPVKLNYQYFAVDQNGPVWEGVKRARSLAAWVPNEFPNPQMELFILLPQKM
ncbi:MAG TPA: type VI secretion system baseplate subunit TssK [Candidatus Koribacter sp.]|jgi:type VI secretion system protein ImpJ